MLHDASLVLFWAMLVIQDVDQLHKGFLHYIKLCFYDEVIPVE